MEVEGSIPSPRTKIIRASFNGRTGDFDPPDTGSIPVARSRIMDKYSYDIVAVSPDLIRVEVYRKGLNKNFEDTFLLEKTYERNRDESDSLFVERCIRHSILYMSRIDVLNKEIAKQRNNGGVAERYTQPA